MVAVQDLTTTWRSPCHVEEHSELDSGTSIPQLREAILSYVDAHNENGKPFRWRKTADEILDKVRRFGLRTQQVHAQ